MDWNTYLEQLKPQLDSWFEYLHSHAELSFHEVETTAFLTKILSDIPGMEVSHPCRTGVIGRLRGNRPGKTVAFRADIDALPLQEQVDLPWKSIHPGVMHACGHDGHAASLLGMAWIFGQMGGDFPGEVRFIFEHGEETSPCGAAELLASGALDGIDEIYAAHLDVFLPVGRFRVTEGPVMAAAYTFTIDIHGTGGHAAFPHQAMDTVYVASQVISQLHGVVSRCKDPMHRAVLTITQLQGAPAPNIIPADVHLGGTIRILDGACIDSFFEAIRRVVTHTCAAYGITGNVDIQLNNALLSNPPANAAWVRRVLENQFGQPVLPDAPVMGGEAFGTYSEKIPNSCYFKVGALPDDDAEVFPHHHAKFHMNRKALPVMVEAGVAILLHALQNDLEAEK